LLRSDPLYILAALDSIERKEGSIDAYFDRVLGIVAKDRARIRDLLLEPKL
jgi:protein-tyrosine phosphatase